LPSSERTIEDRLREEYFDLLPEMRRVSEQLDAEIRYDLLTPSCELGRNERLVISSRMKDCESAVRKLRRSQEGHPFDLERSEQYGLTTLNDLAGSRVLVFPRRRIGQADQAMRNFFNGEGDPIKGVATCLPSSFAATPRRAPGSGRISSDVDPHWPFQGNRAFCNVQTGSTTKRHRKA